LESLFRNGSDSSECTMLFINPLHCIEISEVRNTRVTFLNATLHILDDVPFKIQYAVQMERCLGEDIALPKYGGE
jgi:hypothetical protein